MAYYNTCPHCGANLDPGEPCDCMMERKKQDEFYENVIKVTHKSGQLSFSLNSREVGYEKAAY